jgi:NAD(P)-dependent dehydrogenase (short-subunit alcohol dehydrogenase family)
MNLEAKTNGNQKLAGRVAIITGSSRGMGRASALLFGEHGANVVVNYYGNKKAADKVVNKIKESGGDAVAVQADVGKMKDLPKLVDAALDKWGKIDILYHNAAIHYCCPEMEDCTEEVWDNAMNQIVKGPFFLTNLCVPHILKQGGGSVLFTSTSSTSLIPPMDPQYIAAKGAVNTLYRCFAGWYSPEIRVNCIVPGAIKTDMLRHAPPAVWEAQAASIPAEKLGTPMDIARAALFLVSDDAEYLTGTSITVDGGRTSAVSRKGPLGQMVKTLKPGTAHFSKEDYGEENIKDIDAGI